MQTTLIAVGCSAFTELYACSITSAFLLSVWIKRVRPLKLVVLTASKLGQWTLSGPAGRLLWLVPFRSVSNCRLHFPCTRFRVSTVKVCDTKLCVWILLLPLLAGSGCSLSLGLSAVVTLAALRIFLLWFLTFCDGGGNLAFSVVF